MLTCEYGLMYLNLDDYPPYSGKNSDIFETHINSKLICIHGYINCMRHTDLITWVSNSAWNMLLSKVRRMTVRRSEERRVAPQPLSISSLFVFNVSARLYNLSRDFLLFLISKHNDRLQSDQ